MAVHYTKVLLLCILNVSAVQVKKKVQCFQVFLLPCQPQASHSARLVLLVACKALRHE